MLIGYEPILKELKRSLFATAFPKASISNFVRTHVYSIGNICSLSVFKPLNTTDNDKNRVEILFELSFPRKQRLR